MYKNRKNEKGMALPITLFLIVLAIALFFIIFMFLIYGKRVGVVSERYSSVLEAARGGAAYIIKQLDLGGELLCYNSQNTSISCKCYEVNTIYDSNLGKYVVKCPDGNIVDRMDLGAYKTITSPSGEVYNLEAILFYKKTSSDGLYYIYSFEIKAKKENSNEQSIIDIVYKAPSKSSF